MFQGGKMYYMLLTNKEKKNYFGNYGQGDKINKAKHLDIREVLSNSTRTSIRVMQWVIIRINDDGRKEIFTLEQLEQENPEMVERPIEPSYPIEWFPNLGYYPEIRVIGDWT